MIGNDIIDLKAIRQRSPQHWQRYRAKTMTAGEQVMLAGRRYNLRRTERSKFNKLFVPYQADNLDIWMAWVVKESVYKLEFQLEQQRYFAPKEIQLITFNASDFKGQAKGKFGVYNFEILLTEKFLHALAWSKLSDKPDYHCLAVDNRSLNEHLTETIQAKFPNRNLQYQRQPFPLFIVDKELNISVSKSHHGEWGAFAY